MFMRFKIQLIPAEMMIFWQVHQYWFLEFVCNMLSKKGVVMIIWSFIKHALYHYTH